MVQVWQQTVVLVVASCSSRLGDKFAFLRVLIQCIAVVEHWWLAGFCNGGSGKAWFSIHRPSFCAHVLRADAEASGLFTGGLHWVVLDPCIAMPLHSAVHSVCQGDSFCSNTIWLKCTMHG